MHSLQFPLSRKEQKTTEDKNIPTSANLLINHKQKDKLQYTADMKCHCPVVDASITSKHPCDQRRQTTKIDVTICLPHRHFSHL